MSTDPLVPYRFRRNLVLAASAGTGKTHTLIGVLVHALLGRTASDHAARDVRPEGVVATTFSRKAAAEIRGRLHGAIERLATSPESSPYFGALAAVSGELGVDPSAEAIAAAAARVRSSVSETTVGTLHSFASRVVRASASRAGFPPDLVVDDERAAGERRAKAIREALDLVLETSARERIRRVVDVLGGIEHLEAWVDRRLEQLAERGVRATEVVAANGDCDAIEEQIRALLERVSAVASDPKYEVAAAALLGAWHRGDARAVDEALSALGEIRKPSAKSITAAQSDFADFIDALPGGKSKASRLQRLVESYANRHEHLPQHEALRDLLVAAERCVTAAERSSGALGFSAVLRVARELLAESPDVARAAGRAITVLAVDEFQDTSQVQLDVLKLLRAEPEALAKGVVPHLSTLRREGLLVVGDRKQSIYEFRGADVGVFSELCVGLAGRVAREALAIDEGAAWEPAEPSADFVALQHNRRGTPQLLAFANAFSRESFRTSDGAARLYEVSYRPETEDLRVPPDGPTERTASEGPRVRWIRPAEAEATPSARLGAEAACDAIVAMIAPPSSETAPIRPRDVAVLAASNATLDEVAFGLANRGVPHVMAGRGFFRASEVQDLVAMLRLVEHEDDRLALATVLRGPWCGLSDTTLLALSEAGVGLRTRASSIDVSTVEPAGSRDEARRARDLLLVVESLREARERLGPRGVLREAVRELRLLEVLVQLPRGSQRVANVEKALRMAGRSRHIHDAIARFEAGTEQGSGEAEAATFSEDDDAVRLLTIHASKGLAFPVVVIPEVAKKMRLVTDAATLHFGERGAPPELSASLLVGSGRTVRPASLERAREDIARRRGAERARLAYVAVTRAEREMVLVGGQAAAMGGRSATSAQTIAAALEGVLSSQRAGETVLEEEAPGPRRALEPVEPPHEVRPPVEAIAATPRPARRLALAPTALADFAHCPRRFELVHVDGLPERARGRGARPEGRAATEGERGEVPLDARLEGTLAHRVLERLAAPAWGTARARSEASALLAAEGVGPEHSRHAAIVGRVVAFVESEYARAVTAEGASLLREHAFVLEVHRGGVGLVLGGTIDLLVEWPDGSLDVVDYKRAVGPDLDPYGFQLDIYRLAVLARSSRVRAGIVFLGGLAQEPLWRAPFDAETLERDLIALAGRLAEARARGTFSRASVAVCEGIHCGFIRRCHPHHGASESADA